MLQPEKRPRHYAIEILLMDSLEERREALNRLPDDLRAWVETYLRQWWPSREKYKQELQNSNKT